MDWACVVPGEVDRVDQHTGEALALREELTHKLRELLPDQFEQVLRHPSIATLWKRIRAL